MHMFTLQHTPHILNTVIFYFLDRKTHLECFRLLTNVSIKLLCVFAVSGQL